MLPANAQPLVPVQTCIRQLGCKQWYDNEGTMRFVHPIVGEMRIEDEGSISTFSPEDTNLLIDELEATNMVSSKVKFFSTLEYAKSCPDATLAKRLDDMQEEDPVAWTLLQRKAAYQGYRTIHGENLKKFLFQQGEDLEIAWLFSG